MTVDWRSLVPGDGYERDCLVARLESYDRECLADGLLDALEAYWASLGDDDESLCARREQP